MASQAASPPVLHHSSSDQVSGVNHIITSFIPNINRVILLASCAVKLPFCCLSVLSAVRCS